MYFLAPHTLNFSPFWTICETFGKNGLRRDNYHILNFQVWEAYGPPHPSSAHDTLHKTGWLHLLYTFPWSPAPWKFSVTSQSQPLAGSIYYLSWLYLRLLGASSFLSSDISWKFFFLLKPLPYVRYSPLLPCYLLLPWCSLPAF